MEHRPILLVLVSPDSNANKYYNMYPEGNTFRVEFGRVGSGKQTRRYPMSQWDKKYREKLSKGYHDVTNLSQDLITEQAVNDPYLPIEDADIRCIVDRLRTMAKEVVEKNYTVAASQVTRAMIDEADALIRVLTCESKNVETFNQTLIKLFHAIPRRMGDVRSHVATCQEDFGKIIMREIDLLDVMRGQVFTAPPVVKPDALVLPTQTVLEANGLSFESITDADKDVILQHLGPCKDQFVRAWRVCNQKTAAAFDAWQQTHNHPQTRLLWHGSRNENWWSIINMGLVLRPNAAITGKMFGYGIYFAPSAKKSIGYTSLSGSYWVHGHSPSAFLSLYETSYGKPYDVYRHDHNVSRMTYDNLQSACPDASCLHAHAGDMLRNDEIVFYKEEQMTIRYLVEIKR